MNVIRSAEPESMPYKPCPIMPTPILPPRASRPGTLSIVLPLLFLALTSAATIPSPEKLLPQDTLIVVTVPDFAKMRELWKHCPQTRLWNDPAMKPFKDKFLARWNEEFVQPLERDLGVRFDDYDSLLQGQVTFALTQNGWQGSNAPSPAALLLLDARDKKDQLKKNLADLRKKWVDAGKSIRTEKIRGIEFSVVQISSNDVPKTLRKVFSQSDGGSQPDENGPGSLRQELAVGQFESLLIAGNSIPAVEKIIVHLTGGAMPALADLPAFEADRLALFRDAPCYGWANLKSFLDVLNRKSAESREADEADPLAMLNPTKILTAVGLGGLKTFAFSVQNSDEGSFVRVWIGAPEPGRQGILKLLPGQGKESSPPPFVPADVVKFQRCRIDGQKAWATIQNVMNDVSPQLVSGLNFLLDTADRAAKEKDPGFEIRKNLFGNLGDDLISYQKTPRGSSLAESNAPPSLFLISSPQPESLATALKCLGALWNPPGGSAPEREFLGRKIYSLPLPGMPLASADPSQSASHTLNYAASGGYIALSTDASVLEEYLRSSESQQKTLRETPGLVDAAAKVGGMSTGWFGYENQTETSRILFDTLRRISTVSTNGSGGAVFPGSPAFPGSRSGLKEWLDFSLLPPFEKVSRYFYFTVHAAGANADGLAFNWFAPTPPGLKK
jgi:hypothetical protein